MPAGHVEYEPVSVKAVLVEMKDTAELLVDLAYSAVLFGSDEVAEEVLALEERMDVLQLQARMSLLMAARNPEEAEQLAPVLGVVGATEKISNAAGDVAKVVLEDLGVPDAMVATLPEAVETVARATVAPDSPYAGRTLGEVALESETGVRVIAVRRTGEWLLDPGPETDLRTDDVLLLRGPEDALAGVFETATGDAYQPVTATEPAVPDLERAVDSLVLMKDMSELAVDLAYDAVLYDSDEVAEEVYELEAEVDHLQSRFEAWVLAAAAAVDDPVSLRGLVRLARSTETISDAALEISEGVLRDLDTHPVVAEAVAESEELITRLEVARGSSLDGVTLREPPVAETGVRVVAVRRGDGRAPSGKRSAWVVSPRADTGLRAGDVLVVKGTATGVDRLAERAGGPADPGPP
ncbi:MAG: potassium channel family protein [Halobacteriaceae archaeon]